MDFGWQVHLAAKNWMGCFCEEWWAYREWRPEFEPVQLLEKVNSAHNCVEFVNYSDMPAVSNALWSNHSSELLQFCYRLCTVFLHQRILQKTAIFYAGHVENVLCLELARYYQFEACNLEKMEIAPLFCVLILCFY